MPKAGKNAAVREDAESEWVSLHEATKLLEENREEVLRLGVEQRLEVKRFGRWTFVKRDSIDRYLAAPAV